MMSVNVVVGNTSAADDMITNMNKNIATHLTHFLLSTGTGKTFVEGLIKASIDPALIHQVGACTWDAIPLKLATSNDAVNTKKKNIKDAGWYQKRLWWQHGEEERV